MGERHIPMLKQAGKKVDFLDLSVFSSRSLENDSSNLEEALEELNKAHIILLYRSSESFWDLNEESLKRIGQKVPIICVGYDPSLWLLSTAGPSVVRACHRYITLGGSENFYNMLCYLSNVVAGYDVFFDLPQKIPLEKLYHPKGEKN